MTTCAERLSPYPIPRPQHSLPYRGVVVASRPARRRVALRQENHVALLKHKLLRGRCLAIVQRNDRVFQLVFNGLER